MIGTYVSCVTELLFLFALGLGYIVLSLARKEEKVLRVIGYVIGGGIIALVLFYISVNFFSEVLYNRNMLRYHKAIMQRHMMQPRTPK